MKDFPSNSTPFWNGAVEDMVVLYAKTAEEICEPQFSWMQIYLNSLQSIIKR